MLRYWWCSFSTGAVVLRVFDIHIRQISSEVNLYTSAAVWCDNKDIVVRHAFSTRAIWVKRVRNIFVYRVVCRSSPETTWAVCTWYSAEFALLSYFHCSQTTSCDAGKEIVSNIPEQTHVCVCVLCVVFVVCIAFYFSFRVLSSSTCLLNELWLWVRRVNKSCGVYLHDKLMLRAGYFDTARVCAVCDLRENNEIQVCCMYNVHCT